MLIHINVFGDNSLIFIIFKSMVITKNHKTIFNSFYNLKHTIY